MAYTQSLSAHFQSFISSRQCVYQTHSIINSSTQASRDVPPAGPAHNSLDLSTPFHREPNTYLKLFLLAFHDTTFSKHFLPLWVLLPSHLWPFSSTLNIKCWFSSEFCPKHASQSASSLLGTFIHSVRPSITLRHRMTKYLLLRSSSWISGHTYNCLLDTFSWYFIGL